MTLSVYIFHDGIPNAVKLPGKIVFTTYRHGAAGKLQFTVSKEAGINFTIGDHVQAILNGDMFFAGKVFTKERKRPEEITVTAYDVLRYFANRDVFAYTARKASEVISHICADNQIPINHISDTFYRIPARAEENVTLFDMAENALDETYLATGIRYILSTKRGGVTLQALSDRKSGVWLDKSRINSYHYSNTVDKNVYTRVRLYRIDKLAGMQVAVEQSSALVNQWGVLQYFAPVEDTEDANGKAAGILNAFGDAYRTLTLHAPVGNLRAVGGSTVGLSLDMGDEVLSGEYVVERAEHCFFGGKHEMTLQIALDV